MKKNLFILIFSLLSLGIYAQNSTPDSLFKVKVGDMAPNFTISLPSGKTCTLSSLRGKVVMLQFTASWCPVCRKEMPHIEQEIWQRHKNNPNFALFGIDREEDAATIQHLKKKVKVTYPIAFDHKGDIFGLYADKKKAGITRNVLIDKTGKIVKLTRLYDEKDFNDLVSKIDNLLAQ